MTRSAFSRSTRAAVSLVLEAQRAAIVEAIIAGAASSHPKLNRFGDSPAQFRHRIDAWFTLLVGFFLGKEGYDALLGGQTLLELYQPERSAEENYAFICADVAALRVEIEAVARAALESSPRSARAGFDAERQTALSEGLQEVFAGLVTKSERHVRTLLVGDCLLGEVAGLAADVLARKGISFDPYPMNARDSLQLGRHIDALAKQKYEAIFFSPFSHARTGELEELMRPSARLALHDKAVDALADRVVEQADELLSYLLGRFECPIYVHDAGLVPRATSRAKSLAFDLATRRQRRRAGERLDEWLRKKVDSTTVNGSRRVHIIEESALVASLGVYAAGRYLHASEFQHATGLSLALAHQYAERLEMLATLNGKKLVVCDLDNTLWEGTIGEGAVTHFVERQTALLRLKRNSGVVLSIASKNDPAKVHFTGGLLAEGDFVAPQISWGFKADAFKIIRDVINIQHRHMVFLDDRADERALVTELYPDVLALDATDPAVWRRIALWADLVEGSSDLDRTKLYQEQTARDAFTGTGGTVAAADAATIARLGLTIEVRTAAKADLKRVAELINRTNQWNMCGSRTSVSELAAVVAAGGLVLLARVQDRFGDMGDVCAAVVSIAGGRAAIPIFVLSCRVFGYGVEAAMLKEISARVGLGSRVQQLAGRYIATNQNQMARNMYADNGFRKDGDGFVLEHSEPELRAS
ncbi:MAG: family phosphatase [Myxococcaceae bacterium]|nr:family phosphatase [Myxococcaceae bacterium]